MTGAELFDADCRPPADPFAIARGLFQEEAQRWREELHWDYRPSIELVRKFIDSRALGGYAAIENGRPAGYGFYVLEDHKGLIGGLVRFVAISRRRRVTERLLTEMLVAHCAPRRASSASKRN